MKLVRVIVYEGPDSWVDQFCGITGHRPYGLFHSLDQLTWEGGVKKMTLLHEQIFPDGQEVKLRLTADPNWVAPYKEDIVHIGSGLCNSVKGLPFQWPPGHTWITREQARLAMPQKICPACKERFKELENAIRVTP